MLQILLVTGLVLALAVIVACGGSSEHAQTVGPRGYVELADAALRGPARMARLVGRQAGPRPAPAPARADVDRLVADAEAAGDMLDSAELGDPGLRRQRDALLARQRAIVAVMRRLADPLAQGDREVLRSRAPAFYALMRRLPSDVAAGSPS